MKLDQLRPGRDVCMAASVLWLTGIPPGLPDAAIRAECSSYGSVVDVLQSTAPPHDEAFVAFADIRCALVHAITIYVQSFESSRVMWSQAISVHKAFCMLTDGI